MNYLIHLHFKIFAMHFILCFLLDIMESPWQLCPEYDVKMRQVTYTITLNHAMAKSAQTTETQVLIYKIIFTNFCYRFVI